MTEQRRHALTAAAIAFGVHLVANPHYGFFRDELYFIACGRHPAAGYVDQPPLVPLLAAASQLLGTSLLLLRAVAAAFAGASVYVTYTLAGELGGGGFARAVAAFAAAACPVLCNFGMKLSTDTVGAWAWPAIVLCVLRQSRGGDPRGWLAVGALVGVAGLAKYNVVFFVVAYLAAIACVPQRRILWSRWFAAGLGIALVMSLPSVWWQVAHGFPQLEVLRDQQHGKNVMLSPLEYLVAQLVITNPVLAPIWIAGLVRSLRSAGTRFIGIGYVVLIAIMIALHAKHYYPADVYPVLFAIGAVAVEGVVRAQRWRAVVVAVAIGGSLVVIPYVLPVLPITAFVRYHAVVGPLLHVATARTENAPPSPLPQDWADMQGWPELAAAVARVYAALPAGERPRAAIVASNYGEAAAIDFFGRDLGLPPALSGHNQYFLWGTHGFTGDVVIDVGGDCGARNHLFREHELATELDAPLATPWEAHLPIRVCRGLRVPLAELWPRVKLYY